MIMEPNNYQDFETTLIRLVNAGDVPMSRIDDAVSRILAKKFELGLFEHPVHEPHRPRPRSARRRIARSPAARWRSRRCC